MEPFERVVIVGEGPVDEHAGPALRDHVGWQLHRQAQSSDGAWLDSRHQSQAANAFLRVLDQALHGQLTRPVTDDAGWAAFVAASRATADEVLAVLDGRRTLVYLRGPAMLLVPAALREQRPDLSITLRLPTPWPAPELFARLPWRAQLLEGAAGADVLSVSSERDRKNLTRSFGRYLDGVGVAVRKGTLLLADGRRTRTISNPPGVALDDIAAISGAPAVDEEARLWRARLGGRSLVLTVGRLRGSSGLLEQLTAVERLLESKPELGEQLAFVVVAVEPPGGSSDARREIESAIGRINGRFTPPGGEVPVHYLHGGVPPHVLAALYRTAEVLVVTPLVAAASLAVKEYVIVQHDSGGAGRVLLSETSGTAAELEQVRTCNPFDLDDIAEGITGSWRWDPVEAKRGLAAMAARIRRHDVQAWWRRELAFAADPRLDLPDEGPEPGS